MTDAQLSAPQMDKYFRDELKRLQEFTRECRNDMHEPDEQDIYAEFGPHIVKLGPGAGDWIRTGLDNACSGEGSYDMGFWLIHREYYDDGSYKEVREWFNLANIIALARMAK